MYNVHSICCIVIAQGDDVEKDEAKVLFGVWTKTTQYFIQGRFYLYIYAFDGLSLRDSQVKIKLLSL